MKSWYLNSCCVLLAIFLFNSSVGIVWAQFMPHVSAEKVLGIGITDLENSVEEAKRENASISSQNEILRGKVLRLQEEMNILQEEENKLFLAMNEAKSMKTGLQMKKTRLSQKQLSMGQVLDHKKDELAKIRKAIDLIGQDRNKEGE